MAIIGGLRASGQSNIVDRTRLLELALSTIRYSDSATTTVAAPSIGMFYQGYYTNARTGLETQPVEDGDGNLFAFDGRLDNYQELITDLNLSDQTLPDSHIVRHAFMRWGEVCFRRFVGDWAVAIWSKSDRTLYLARDHAGTRSLYYKTTSSVIAWSTYVDALVPARSSESFDERYFARYLCGRSTGSLTPFEHIHSVPPGHYVVFSESGTRIESHWQPLASQELRYKTNREYEEHFLHLFKRAVERRTGPGAPILAQLSGGMDSTSIVCVSDMLRHTQGSGSADLVETVSFYNELEPSWNEHPYFSITEQIRGKSGFHINMATDCPTYAPFDVGRGDYFWPGADSGTIDRELEFEEIVGPQYRVIINGSGGDELLGGVPDGFPELSGYLVSGNLRRFLITAFRWCMVSRTSLTRMIFDTFTNTARLYRSPNLESATVPPWILPAARSLSDDTDCQSSTKIRTIGHSPKEIVNAITWPSVIGALPHLNPASRKRYEYRYPYLDRDLVEFLFSVPREQLVRPGRRRALMRSALRGIVPNEVLERKRKAFLMHSLILSVRGADSEIRALLGQPMVAQLGLVEPRSILAALDRVVRGADLHLQRGILTTLALEIWLRSRVRTHERNRVLVGSTDFALSNK